MLKKCEPGGYNNEGISKNESRYRFGFVRVF